MAGLVGFSPPHSAPERVQTRGWARDDVLPGINAGVSRATRHMLPTPRDRSRRPRHRMHPCLAKREVGHTAVPLCRSAALHDKREFLKSRPYREGAADLKDSGHGEPCDDTPVGSIG